MQLQRRLSRKIGNKIYYKWIVTIPPSTIKKLGWTKGKKLQAKTADGELIIRPYKKKA